MRCLCVPSFYRISHSEMGLNEDLPSTSDGSETGFETGGSDDFPTKPCAESPVVLNVCGTDLSESAACIPEFSAALQRVNMSMCRLSSVPSELFCCARNLTVLNLSLNRLRTLSPKFGRFCRCVKLSILNVELWNNSLVIWNILFLTT